MSQIEREIKLLNIDVKRIKSILESKNIKSKGKFIQDIYTFDIPPVYALYKKYVKILIKENDVRGLKKLILEIKPCFDEADSKIIKQVLGTEDMLDFISANVDYEKLQCDELINIMKKTNDNFSKWVRLRQTGDETTITIKKIVNSKGKYELDAVNELEFSVPNITDGKQLLEDLGYFSARHQIKMRIAYDYKNTEIVIDKWPKLNPYIEIEANTKEEIDEAVLMLGYNLEDAIVINTDDVYSEAGIDIYSKEYIDLSFSKEEMLKIKEYME